jgi:hypothetical protein
MHWKILIQKMKKKINTYRSHLGLKKISKEVFFLILSQLSFFRKKKSNLAAIKNKDNV